MVRSRPLVELELEEAVLHGVVGGSIAQLATLMALVVTEDVDDLVAQDGEKILAGLGGIASRETGLQQFAEDVLYNILGLLAVVQAAVGIKDHRSIELAEQRVERCLHDCGVYSLSTWSQ